VDLKAEAARDDLLAEHLRKVGNDPSSDGYQMDYALKLGDGNKITHNRFVVPDWGVLRFDLYAPEPNGGEVKVTVKGDSSSKTETIFLEPASNAKSYNAADKYRIGYGNQGFETFHVEIPQELRGKVATLEFDVEGSTQVLLDDVFFKSQHLLLGNPTLNRRIAGQDKNNFLIERPQYSASYNESDKGANWVSWHTNEAWLGDLTRNDTSKSWRIDPFLSNAGINSVKSSDYNRAALFDRGHVMARELRNRTPKDQLATYFTSNLLPHEKFTNENEENGMWRSLEVFNKRLVDNKNWNIYTIAGGIGSLNNSFPNNPLVQNGVNIPESIWQVNLLLKPGQDLVDITADTTVIGVVLPNDPAQQSGSWLQHTKSIGYIEEKTGLSLLSNLPEEVRNALKGKEYSGTDRVEDFLSASAQL
jgi:DNA/RNA endonuclease G (NUC1)